MPYHTNNPNYQTSHSRLYSFKDFDKKQEETELKDMKRNFKKRGEMHQAPGERKHKWSTITHKIDDLSVDEIDDELDALEEDHQHLKNYMFFNSVKNICRMSRKILKMDPLKIDDMLNNHDWAKDHVSTSRDDMEEVFNWIMSSIDQP
jgi:DNA-binding transcriptional MerR regulator